MNKRKFSIELGKAVNAEIKWSQGKRGRTSYLSAHCLFCSGTGHIYQHRLLMGNPVKMEIDHIDGNGLNNVESNLRVVTKQQNLRNSRKQKRYVTSKYKGVSWHKGKELWRASFSVDGKFVHVGYFKTQIKAAKAYDAEIMKAYGKYAFQNFPRRS